MLYFAFSAKTEQRQRPGAIYNMKQPITTCAPSTLIKKGDTRIYSTAKCAYICRMRQRRWGWTILAAAGTDVFPSVFIVMQKNNTEGGSQQVIHFPKTPVRRSTPKEPRTQKHAVLRLANLEMVVTRRTPGSGRILWLAHDRALLVYTNDESSANQLPSKTPPHPHRHSKTPQRAHTCELQQG